MDISRPRNAVSRDVEHRAWQLRLKGQTQTEIAAVLGISQSAVSRALRRFEQRVFQQLSDNIGRLKGRLTAQLEHTAAEAWRAWEASKEPTVTTETTDDDQGNRKVKRIVRTPKTGDPRFLAEYRQALADQTAIWGLKARPIDTTATGERTTIEVRYTNPTEGDRDFLLQLSGSGGNPSAPIFADDQDQDDAGE